MALPYVTGSNGCGAPTLYDVLSSDINHEYAEIETDWNTTTGWLDTSQNEIADLCEDPNVFPLRQVEVFASNTSFAAYHVGLQPLWSNAAKQGIGACVYARSTGTANFYVGGDGQVWLQQNVSSTATAWGQPLGYSSGTRFTGPVSAASWGPYLRRRSTLSGQEISRQYGYPQILT